MPKSSTIFAKTLFSWLSPFSILFMFSVVSVFCNVLKIKSFFSCGISFASRKALIFLTIISPSLLPISMEDFKSDFSSGATFPGIPKVAMIEAATR